MEDIINLVNCCNKCEISKTKINYVFSRGNPKSNLLILGEAPGEDEDILGLPFVGKSGKFLDRAISSLNFNINDDIYITNVIKCRPTNNRKPSEKEIKNCSGFLKKQFKFVNPKVIITLGNVPLKVLVNQEGISKIRGIKIPFKGRTIIPTYHPSFLIRTGGVASKYFNDFISDLKLAFSLKGEVK